MADIKQNETVTHELSMRDRNTLTMNGVTEVVSFDDTSVIVKTVCGELTVDGNDLHITTLDTARGAVAVNGNIQSLTYYDAKPDRGKGFFGKASK